MAEPARQPEDLLTVQDVARILRVSPSWVYTNKARIGYVRVGGLRFEPEDVRRFRFGIRPPLTTASYAACGASGA